MINYFSNAFFHKRISDSFIASQGGPVGKVVATVKCEDLRKVVAMIASWSVLPEKAAKLPAFFKGCKLARSQCLGGKLGQSGMLHLAPNRVAKRPRSQTPFGNALP